MKIKNEPDNESRQSKTTPSSKVRRLYHQKYREDWERFPSFAGWLCRGEDGFTAHCRICDATVLARLASIKQHDITAKHQKAVKNHPFVAKAAAALKIEAMVRTGPKGKGKAKPKPKAKRMKIEKIETPAASIDADACSNDSILEDLLGNDDDHDDDDEIEQQYMNVIDEQDGDEFLKAEVNQDFKMEDMHDEGNLTDDNIISEFDLFGKSVSLQLNHMELEDALLCQERLQVVMTEFRLKILKRKGKKSF